MEITLDDYLISTDRQRLDLKFIHHYLSTEAYWSPGIPFEIIQRASENSLCFGMYFRQQQIGYARIISDFTTIAYLADVFIVSGHRGKGLGKWLIQTIRVYPELQGLRRWILLTRDAHRLYQQFGWQSIAHPELYMEIHNQNVYTSNPEGNPAWL